MRRRDFLKAPYRDLTPLSPKEVGVRNPSWTQVEPLSPNRGCRNDDATANGKDPSEINEGEDLVAIALKHVEDKKSRWR
jgi:hypothetical protein